VRAIAREIDLKSGENESDADEGNVSHAARISTRSVLFPRNRADFFRIFLKRIIIIPPPSSLYLSVSLFLEGHSRARLEDFAIKRRQMNASRQSDNLKKKKTRSARWINNDARNARNEFAGSGGRAIPLGDSRRVFQTAKRPERAFRR